MMKRISVYLNEMFPPAAFFASIFSAVAVQLVYLRLFNIRPPWGLQLFLPGLVITFISLLIRVMDEFKDYQDDLRNFPERPLPSGRVKASDLKVLGFFCVFMAIVLSSTSFILLAWGLINLAFTGLMLKWFFIEERMRKSLPLAFVTHHPIVLLNFIYLIVACIQLSADVTGEKWMHVIPLCLMYTNWEVMRKIRAPGQETSYTTYSKILGPRVAIGIALLLQMVFLINVGLIFLHLGSPLWLQLAFMVLQFILAFPALRFFFTLKLNGPLRPMAEAQILVVVTFLFIAAVI